MICKNCGKEIDNNFSFCGHCGSRVVNMQDDNGIVAEQVIEENQEGNNTLAQKTFDNERQISNSNDSNQSLIKQNSSGNNISPKSRLVAMLLALFIGSFGAHNFYLGKQSLAISQLIIFLISMIFMLVYMSTGLILHMAIYTIATLVVGIWVLADFIVIIIGKEEDKDGKPVTRWTD